MRITEQDWRGIVNRRKDHIAPIICEVMPDMKDSCREILFDLFGDIIVERRWGRIGGRGQSRVICYASVSLAEDAAAGLVRAKMRRGYHAAA